MSKQVLQMQREICYYNTVIVSLCRCGTAAGPEYSVLSVLTASRG